MAMVHRMQHATHPPSNPYTHQLTSEKWSVNHMAMVTSPFTARSTSKATASSCSQYRRGQAAELPGPH